MSKINSIAIYCGSSKGNSILYADSGNLVGKILAEEKISLIYGAGNVGIMGVIADAVLENNGTVVGVIPEFLKDWEVYHPDITELIVTETMHQRKQIMADKSDAFVMLPGGFGTLDEFFEIVTWKQLHLHEKPIGILNVNGYYDHILQHIKMMVKEGFLKEINLDLIVTASNFPELLEKLKTSKFQIVGKWVKRY